MDRVWSPIESSNTVLKGLALPTQVIPGGAVAMPPIGSLLDSLMESLLVLTEEWELLPAGVREELSSCGDIEVLLALLVRHGLITQYQADRVGADKTFGMMLGNYRVLDRIGAGAMGVVFLGEHVRMRRQVAIKVLPLLEGQEDSREIQRFRNEMRAVAQLSHPNIVTALDDGTCIDPTGESPSLQFFVMEFVPGMDLERLVAAEGPLSPARACGLAYQIASALAAAHARNLVHRDIKPSNIRVTPDGQVKVLDFGLVRQFGHRITLAGTTLGTPEYLAPEQARDASTVDIRADLYSLGGTLFWCLTGRTPFACRGSLAQVLITRLTQAPPDIRSLKPDLPADLQNVVSRLLATDPNDRYPTPQAVMNALLGFLDRGSHEQILERGLQKQMLVPSAMLAVHGPPLAGDDSDAAVRPVRVLVVDDSALQRFVWVSALEDAGIAVDQAVDGEKAVTVCQARPYDVVLTDIEMPGMTGLELCQKLREGSLEPHLKVILFSAFRTDDAMAEALAAGADDYLHKQCSPVQMVSRVKAALRLKRAQEQADLLHRRLLAANRHLEQTLTARSAELIHLRNALVLGLADLASHRDSEKLAHFMRLQRYCRWLAEEAARIPSFSEQIDASFIQLLETCAPLHDIGKVGLPDHILAKGRSLETTERLIMQTHASLGAETLQRVARRHGPAVAFLQMAIDIARHHHERFDGTGYPDRLSGQAIPLAARIFAIGDVYDALRLDQPYKPALSHEATMEIMLEGSPGQFDPTLLEAFRRCAARFEETYEESTELPY